MNQPANVLLVVTAGPRTGTRIPIPFGASVTIGRTMKSQVVLGEDTYLSGLHFRIGFDGSHCILRDEQSANGTIVNSRRVSEIQLQHGDFIEAGQSRFLVQMEAASVPGPTSRSTIVPVRAQPRNPAQHEIARQLETAGAGLPLYCLLDPPGIETISTLGRAPRFEPLLNPPGNHHESYLVEIDPANGTLAELLGHVWGRGCGIFLASRQKYDVVQRHLRAFSLTHTSHGHTLRLRLHDPRLLQLLLDSASLNELAALFGPVESFYCEDRTHPSSVLEYSLTQGGLRRSMLHPGPPLSRAATAE